MRLEPLGPPVLRDARRTSNGGCECCKRRTRRVEGLKSSTRTCFQDETMISCANPCRHIKKRMNQSLDHIKASMGSLIDGPEKSQWVMVVKGRLKSTEERRRKIRCREYRQVLQQSYCQEEKKNEVDKTKFTARE